MQSIEQYGFTLIPSESVSEEKYLLIKSYIEKICRNAGIAADILRIKQFSSGNQLYESKYATVNITNGAVRFGIYDITTKKLNFNCSAEMFKTFDDEDCNNVIMRCSSLLNRKAEGRVVNMGSLDEAWKNAIENTYVRTEEYRLPSTGKIR